MKFNYRDGLAVIASVGIIALARVGFAVRTCEDAEALEQALASAVETGETIRGETG